MRIALRAPGGIFEFGGSLRTPCSMVIGIAYIIIQLRVETEDSPAKPLFLLRRRIVGAHRRGIGGRAPVDHEILVDRKRLLRIRHRDERIDRLHKRPFDMNPIFCVRLQDEQIAPGLGIGAARRNFLNGTGRDFIRGIVIGRAGFMDGEANRRRFLIGGEHTSLHHNDWARKLRVCRYGAEQHEAGDEGKACESAKRVFHG